MNPVTFEHITLQTGHSVTQRNFAPIKEAIEVLSALPGPGCHAVLGIRVHAARNRPGAWTFDIFWGDDYVIRAYACYDASLTAEVWADAFAECILRQLGPLSAPMFLPWQDVHAKRPTGPFMLIDMQAKLAAHPAAVALMGDFERCLYWRYAQL